MNPKVPQVPQYTTPLTKFIRTFEGWLVIIATAALILVPIITSALPVELAAKLGAGLAAITVASRSILKLFATKNWGKEDFLPTEVTGESNAVETIPTPTGMAIATSPDTEEFEALPPTEVTPLPVDPAPVVTEAPAVPPPYDREDPALSEEPQGADTPEARGEDPSLRG
jgi:hypothetical protein